MGQKPQMPAGKAAMLLIVTGEGLLMHLRDDKPGIPNPGCWAGFGGAVEDGETVEQALHREVLEETGLDIEGATFLATELDHEGDGREVSLFYVAGDYRPQDIDLREGAGVAVHPVEDLPWLSMSPFVGPRDPLLPAAGHHRAREHPPSWPAVSRNRRDMVAATHVD